MTRYHVLKKVPAASPGSMDDRWEVIARDVEANGAEHALRKTSATDGLSSGAELVAVPSRSWTPVKVKIETTTSVKFAN